MGEPPIPELTHEELCDFALEHYESLAEPCCEWNITIAKALRYYRDQRTNADLGAAVREAVRWAVEGGDTLREIARFCGRECISTGESGQDIIDTIADVLDAEAKPVESDGIEEAE